MFAWIADNLGTILVSLLLVVIVIMIVMIMINDKKKGKSSCGGNCAHCGMGASCHYQNTSVQK